MVTVWFDGGCPLCRREIALMKRLDRRKAIRFINLESAQACPLDRETLLARFHAEEDGHLYEGASAFAAMWRAIPLLRPMGLAARNPLILAVLQWGYGQFLRIRPLLQKLAHRLEG